MNSRGSIQLGILDAIVICILMTSFIMLLQLVFGVFHPEYSVMFSILFCGLVLLSISKILPITLDRRHVIGIVVMAALVLLPRWNPFLYVEGGQDEGIYISMSSYFAREHKLSIVDDYRANISGEERQIYDKNNQLGLGVLAPNKYEGVHQPGVYIADLSKSTYIFQFYPLHPLWMALTAKIFGAEQRVYSLVAFSALSILMLSLLAFEVSGRKLLPAYLTAGLMAINPIHAYFSRFPVSENVTIFFSASAIYYMVRYFKQREQDKEQIAYLILSAGAWGCLFFNHIAGFMYLPLILAVTMAGATTANSPSQIRQLTYFNIAVFGGYLFSVWYGMFWSYPYSRDIYLATFGDGIGGGGVNHWLILGMIALAASSVLVYASWHFREKLLAVWTKRKLGKLLVITMFIVMCAVVLNGIYAGYRLAFTAHYSQDSLMQAFGLVDKGAIGMTYSSAAALAIYMSPFLLLYVLYMVARNRRELGVYEIALVAFCTMFLIVRVGIQEFTFYYYYGRYLNGEVIPYFIVLASIWLGSQLVQQKQAHHIIASTIVLFSFSWAVVALIQQYPGGDRYRMDASLKPLVGRLTENDLLIFSGINFPALRTALDYYYGKTTVMVDAESTYAATRRQMSSYNDVYVLSEKRFLSGYNYVGALSLMRDTYQHDILPLRPNTLKQKYYLYQAFPEGPRSLRPGDVINFGINGNSEPYLGSGWSGEEDQMRWTEGKNAVFNLPISAVAENLSLRVTARSYNNAGTDVLVNGGLRTRWKFENDRYTDRFLFLKKSDVKDGKVTLTFLIPDAKSPHELDTRNGDVRQLGLSFKKVSIERGGKGM